MYTSPQAYRGLIFKQQTVTGTNIVRSIAANEGGGGFFRGLGVSIAVQIPATAVSMAGKS